MARTESGAIVWSTREGASTHSRRHAQKAARGRWDGLAQVAQHSTRHVLISHEILAAADADGVARAMASLAGLEVHVVVTARDPEAHD